MTHSTDPPRRTPILIKSISTLTVLALSASVLVPEFTLAIAFAIATIYFLIGVGFSILPTLSRTQTPA